MSTLKLRSQDQQLQGGDHRATPVVPAVAGPLKTRRCGDRGGDPDKGQTDRLGTLRIRPRHPGDRDADVGLPPLPHRARHGPGAPPPAPGPATPVIETPMSACSRCRTPLAMAAAVSSLTAP